MANLKQKFNKEMVPALQEKLGITNVMAVPRLKKVVINMGVGQALTDKNIEREIPSGIQTLHREP